MVALDPEQNLHPVTERLLPRSAKERSLGQRGVCVWMTGLSGSGKSTLAIGLEQQLHAAGRHVMVLDGDQVRTGLCRDLGFSEADRAENIRRIAEVARLLVGNGTVVIGTFVSPTRAIREQARHIIGADDFLEVFVDSSLEVCEQRDVKGLYAKARSGRLKQFTGIDAPFEAPTAPDLRIVTQGRTPEQSVQELAAFLAPRLVLH